MARVKRSCPADEWAVAGIKPQQAVRLARDANPDACADWTGLVLILPQPKWSFAAEINPIKPAIDAQCCSQAARSARQVAQALDAAIEPHDRDAFKRLKGPDQDACADPSRLA